MLKLQIWQELKPYWQPPTKHWVSSLIDLTYTLKSFDELTKDELYGILQLRIEVFVIEQDCPYQDADGKDQHSHHVLGRDSDGVLHTYTRLVPVGVSYPEHTSIGRVITKHTVRGQGAGVELMEQSMKYIKRLWPNRAIKISAQSHLQRFYNKFGFESIGSEYLEDDIPHMAMVTREL